ncbi:Membrane protein, suppressor for copper-sensitivity ScsD [hydrothermal vent metagenome]|uniref:Membrane protein, suppressor for copper-sensitivity ScsD n=1 Tax=hydrothermal vent metagenome TaxID=652676 RepID=A0A1W1BL24_9ZZZZ
MKEKWTVKSVAKEIVSTLLLLFIVSIVINYIRKPDVTEDIYSLELSDIYNSSIAMYKYKKEPLVLHFWATWCPTCKLEASNIERVSKNYNVVSIAVNSGSNEKIRFFMKEHNLSYTVINDNKGALAKKFGIEAYPTTLIYDKNGKLKFSEVGYSTTLGLQARISLSN